MKPFSRSEARDTGPISLLDSIQIVDGIALDMRCERHNQLNWLSPIKGDNTRNGKDRNEILKDSWSVQ